MKARKVLVATAAAIVATATLAVSTMAAATTFVLDTCDDTSTWATEYGVFTDDKKEGAASIGTADAEGASVIQKIFPAPVDVGVTVENGAVELWVYVEKTDALTQGQFELTSSGNCDVDEYSWDLMEINLQKGWNKLTLKLSEAGVIGAPDLKAINFTRLYLLYDGKNSVRLDDIKVVNLNASAQEVKQEAAQSTQETKTEKSSGNPRTGDASTALTIVAAAASGAILFKRKMK